MHRMSAFAVILALGTGLTSVVCAQATREAVMCRTVTDRGHPVSPGAWFPLGTISLTAWFRADDKAAERAQVQWLLNGVGLVAREVTLETGRPSFSRYALGVDEPLPAGVYEAVVMVGGREVARARARVGGRPPEGPDVMAVAPSEAPAAEGPSGLRRSGRTHEGEAALAPAPATRPRVEPQPDPPAEHGAPQPAVLADSGPPVPTAVEGLVPGAVTPRAPEAPPTGPALPEPPTAVAGVTLGAEPARPGVLPDLPAPSMLLEPIIMGRPTPDELGPVAPEPPAASTFSPGVVTPPAPMPGGVMPIVTAPGAEAPAPSAPAPRAAPAHTAPAEAPVAAESAPAPPLTVPLGPRATEEPAARPLLSRVSPPPAAEAPGATVLSRPGARTDGASPATAIPRTRPGVAPVPPRAGTRTELRPPATPSAARPAPATRERMEQSARPAEEEAEPAVVVPLRPRRPVAHDAPGAVEQAEESVGAPPPPAALPHAAPIVPPDEDPRPADAPGEGPAIPRAVAGMTADAPAAPATAAPGTDDAPTPAPTPPPEAAPLRLEGPLTADALAEDMPPITQAGDAINLHHVTLEQVTEPAGLQPLWVVRVPDGRLWPPGLPTQFGLHAGDAPDPSPTDLLLYSDHIDGVIPLYEVPVQEALLLAARENDAALLSMGREVYEARKEAWQSRARGWRWMWYVRQVDLAAGDTLVAGLVDVRRSPRAPEGFASATQDEVILLDEAGRRVTPGEVTAEMAARVASDLGASAPTAWTAPAAGRYQVWAALGMDKSRARCLVWTATTTPGE